VRWPLDPRFRGDDTRAGRSYSGVRDPARRDRATFSGDFGISRLAPRAASWQIPLPFARGDFALPRRRFGAAQHA